MRNSLFTYEIAFILQKEKKKDSLFFLSLSCYCCRLDYSVSSYTQVGVCTKHKTDDVMMGVLALFYWHRAKRDEENSSALRKSEIIFYFIIIFFILLLPCVLLLLLPSHNALPKFILPTSLQRLPSGIDHASFASRKGMGRIKRHGNRIFSHPER